MQGELRESQTTPVHEGRSKGKEKEKEREVVFSNVEELDGSPSTKSSESELRAPSRIGSAVIATDPAMEVDKAETIPMKPVVRFLHCHFGYEELI